MRYSLGWCGSLEGETWAQPKVGSDGQKKKSFGTNVISVKGINTVEPFVFYKILLRETAHLHSLLSKEGITLPRFPEKALEKKKAGPGQGRPARQSRNWDTNPFISTLKFVCFPEARAATETHQVSVLFREPHVEDVLALQFPVGS